MRTRWRLEGDDARLGISVLASIISAGIAAGLAITVSHRSTETNRRVSEEIRKVQEEQRISMCALILRWDSNYRANPPTTELGRANAEDMHQLRIGFRCDQK